jgi:hypothetical protein
MERRTLNLSEIAAWRGSSSDSRRPGVRAAMVANGPRNSDGASGFGS